MERLDFLQTSPRALKALQTLEQHLSKSGIDRSLDRLVRLRASQINGCAFCIDMHTTEARNSGETARRIALVGAWREAGCFTAREQAALAWTEAVTLVASSGVPDEAWEFVKPHFTPEEVTNLTLLIATINTWNRFAVAFRKSPA